MYDRILFQNSLTYSGKHAVTCIRPELSQLFYLFDRYTCGQWTQVFTLKATAESEKKK